MAMETAAPDRYTLVAIALHWLIAFLIIGQLAGGLFMVGLPDAQASLKFQLFQTHKSFGITILLLSIVRLGWRLTHKAPGLPIGMADWARIAARLTHVGFYVLIIATPLAGWALVSASPYAESVQTFLFGLILWPHLPFFAGVEDRAGVTEAMEKLHALLAFAMIGLLALHIGAALKHHFVDRDGVLARMLPFLKPRTTAS